MKKNIRAQILSGYTIIILIPITITVVTLFFAGIISMKMSDLTSYNTNQNLTKEAEVAHYSWLMQLSDTMVEGVPFNGSLDSTACSLGKWIAEVEGEGNDAVITAAISRVKPPHDTIHRQAADLLELAKTDSSGAYAQYNAQTKPLVAEVIREINFISTQYKNYALQTDVQARNSILYLLVSAVVLAVLGAVAAYIIGIVMAKKISAPVMEVAKWSKKLSLGDNTYNPGLIEQLRLSPEHEIYQMVESFQAMARSVEQNVQVVKRVADGDLTAYVEIRSHMDVLGQSLYRMVQTNDLMFAQIFEVSSNVAASANQISKSSFSLADNASQQAASIEEISSAIAYINELSAKNNEYVADVIAAFRQISKDVEASGREMNTLVIAVDEIRTASDQISAIIKTINDISFQTNILALNAAVEAARAGAAGKGFAVVADEVRQLALKSADAANNTRELIENTISKTHYGTRVAADANTAFTKIGERIFSTTKIMESISAASHEQGDAIGAANASILRVADTQSSAAAFSEQSSAASQQMREYAEVLCGEMKRFNLRQREFGKPYIPNEKQNDADFIRHATENYQKALENGEVAEKRLTLI